MNNSNYEYKLRVKEINLLLNIISQLFSDYQWKLTEKCLYHANIYMVYKHKTSSANVSPWWVTRTTHKYHTFHLLLVKMNGRIDYTMNSYLGIPLVNGVIVRKGKHDAFVTHICLSPLPSMNLSSRFRLPKAKTCREASPSLCKRKLASDNRVHKVMRRGKSG